MTTIGSFVMNAKMSAPDYIACLLCVLILVQPIVGFRYQCASCPSLPSSYNLCSSCERQSYVLHDPMHIFFKVPRPVQRPLESPTPFLPDLYKAPAGPHGTGASYNPSDPRDYLKSLVHPAAVCDCCVTRINGEWFRCAYCPKDLCDACEALDTHDDSHIFFVFKAPVDMNKMRLFAELDNPNGSPPVISYPIYRWYREYHCLYMYATHWNSSNCVVEHYPFLKPRRRRS